MAAKLLLCWFLENNRKILISFLSVTETKNKHFKYHDTILRVVPYVLCVKFFLKRCFKKFNVVINLHLKITLNSKVLPTR